MLLSEFVLLIWSRASIEFGKWDLFGVEWKRGRFEKGRNFKGREMAFLLLHVLLLHCCCCHSYLLMASRHRRTALADIWRVLCPRRPVMLLPTSDWSDWWLTIFFLTGNIHLGKITLFFFRNTFCRNIHTEMEKHKNIAQTKILDRKIAQNSWHFIIHAKTE